MSYEVIQINENTWRIEDGGVRFFLLTGTEKALLIDSGMMVNNAKDIAESVTSLPISLLNTHADRDHIGSNEQFETFYMHPAEEPIYRRSGKPGRVLQIIELPGHTPGSIAVLDVKSRVLISGDPIQENGRIFMFGDHRNMHDYIRSLGQLEKRKGEFDKIWPSHAKLPVSPELIQKLHDGAQDILAGKVQGVAAEMHGKSIIAYDLGFDVLLCDK